MRSLRTRPIQNYQLPPFAGPVAYGSRRASQFFQDLASGANSLDIIVIGDSNTMSASAGSYGYHNGLSQAMQNKGWNCYGTPVYPTMTGWTPGAAYSTGGWNGSAYLAIPTGNLASGNTSGGSTAYSVWTPGTNWVRYGSYTATPPAKDDWAYIASGTYSDNYNAVELAAAHPLNTNTLTLWHRVRYGTFTTGSGSFQGRTRAYAAGPIYATGPSQSTNTGTAYSYLPYEYSFTPQGLYLNSSWSGPTATGPCAIANHSIYCKRKGWSVTSHGYISGADSTTIASVITGAGNTPLQNLLREHRERQIAAGGSGRVLLFVHSGINGSDTATTWTTAHTNIWNTYKSAWSALGYPAADLAIVCFVGVQRNSGDTSNGGASLAAVREAAKTMAVEQGDMTVVHMPSIISYAELSGTPNYYQNQTSSDVHLSGGSGSSTDGYTLVATRILDDLVST